MATTKTIATISATVVAEMPPSSAGAGIVRSSGSGVAVGSAAVSAVGDGVSAGAVALAVGGGVGSAVGVSAGGGVSVGAVVGVAVDASSVGLLVGWAVAASVGVGASVGVASGVVVAVGAGAVAVAVGGAVVAVGAVVGVAAWARTITRPCIEDGWRLHWYVYSPGCVKVREKVPPIESVPECHDSACPPCEDEVWGWPSQRQVTVSPLSIVITAPLKPKVKTETVSSSAPVAPAPSRSRPPTTAAAATRISFGPNAVIAPKCTRPGRGRFCRGADDGGGCTIQPCSSGAGGGEPAAPLRRRLGRFTTQEVVRALWLGLLIGLVAGGAAIVFFEAIEFATEHILTDLTGYVPPQPLGEGSAETSGPTRSWALPIVLGLGGLVSGILVFTFAPAAEGAGADQVIDAFHQRGGRVGWRVIPVKLLASTFTIGSGGGRPVARDRRRKSGVASARSSPTAWGWGRSSAGVRSWRGWVRASVRSSGPPWAAR